MSGVQCPYCIVYVLLEDAKALADHIKARHRDVN
jgi:hypothetical protein